MASNLTHAARTALLSCALALSAGCGGGSSSSAPPAPTPTPAPAPTPSPPATPPTADEAARFLLQATFGPTDTDIARVQSLGYSGWIDEQFALPQTPHLPYVQANYTALLFGANFAFVQDSFWQQAIDMIDKAIIKELSEIVGRENVAEDRETRICYAYDATNIHHLPDLVVFPRTPQHISGILKLANEHRFPVVPRGAGTGFTGGTIPVEGGVVLALTKMNRILKIDQENLLAVVEPGVVTYDFQQEVEKIGLFYPPDPASLKSSTLGGNVAECAGGPRAVKYGVTKDYVLGLEAVLPTGEIISAGVQTVKSVVGYDLIKLMVGSEGTLGVITKIILRLRCAAY